MPSCPSCGKEVFEVKTVCPWCGRPLPQAPPPLPVQPTFQSITPASATQVPSPNPQCAQCGREISVSAKFCPWCGALVPPKPTEATLSALAPPSVLATVPQPSPSPAYYPPAYYPQPPHSHRPFKIAVAALLVVVILLSVFMANIYVFHLGVLTPPRDPYSVMTTHNSQNWSGFVFQSTSDTVTDVKGTWTIPQINCSSSPSESHAAQWVGIDGAGGSNTVEQAGTEYDCNNGAPNIFAWYEYYPSRGFLLNLRVNIGDVITTEVNWDGRQFTASINDVTQGWNFALANSTIGSIALRSTAEWVVEAPLVSGSIASLTDFSKLFFSKSFATVSGTTGPMGSFSLEEFTMVDASQAVKARPMLPLWNDGTSFSVWWLKAGP